MLYLNKGWTSKTEQIIRYKFLLQLHTHQENWLLHPPMQELSNNTILPAEIPKEDNQHMFNNEKDLTRYEI